MFDEVDRNEIVDDMLDLFAETYIGILAFMLSIVVMVWLVGRTIAR